MVLHYLGDIRVVKEFIVVMSVGKPIPKKDALERLKLDNNFIFLFFGFIREYKGLDVLLESLKFYITLIIILALIN